MTAVEQYAAHMKHIRGRRGLSIKDVAANIDGKLSHVTVSNVETGLRDPRLSTIAQLCRAYDVDVVVTRTGDVQVRGTGIRRDDGMDEPPAT